MAKNKKENHNVRKVSNKISALAAYAISTIWDRTFETRTPSSKTPAEDYRIALSSKRGERAYKSYTGLLSFSVPHISIKQNLVGNIRQGTS